MHQSVIDFLRRALTRGEVDGKVVLEVGSRIVFGSPRDVILPMSPKLYIGIDMMDGRGVDLVLPAEKLSTRFSSVDVVVATELLEHVEFWQKAVQEMKNVLKPGGILVVTARGPGFPYHPHPGDFWRFTVENFQEIFGDFAIMSLKRDPQDGHPGVFLKAVKPANHVHGDLGRVAVGSVG